MFDFRRSSRSVNAKPSRLRKPFVAGVTAGAMLSVVAILGAAAALTITFGTPLVSCALDGGVVSAGYTISATAASATLVTETLKDSGGNTVTTKSFTLPAGSVTDGGAWTIAGRSKVYDGTFTTSGLPDGEYSLEVCATQPGSQGNPAKNACITEALLVDCVRAFPTACTDGPFGEVVGNNHIRVNAAAQINFKGNFGTEATVTVEGPDFAETATISQNGNSCTYHANWKFTNREGADLYGNGGPGTYTVVVSGNGKTLKLYVTLTD